MNLVRGWPLRPLSRCARLLSGGTPSKARTDFWEGDIPWVSSGEMSETRIHDTPLRITREAAEGGSRLVPANTVLAVVRGMSLAKEFRVAITKREVAFNQDLKAFACEPDIDPEFLFYALFARRQHIRDLATEASHGTKKLETEVLAAFMLAIPKLNDQKRVVALISAYDDLIENNRRRMKLLEETARLLYQEWFIRLRFPGHEHVEVIKGVRRGWRKMMAFDAMRVMSGGTPKTTTPEFWDGDIPFYTPKDSVGEWYVLDTEKHITDVGLINCNSKIYPKDTIFITARGTVGNLNLAQRPMAMNQSCYALSARQGLSQKILFCMLLEAIQHFQQHAGGAVFDAIIVDTFKLIPFVIPAPKLVELFEEAIAPMFHQAENLLLQNQKLSAARDLLLAGLMNGETAV